MPEPIRRRYGRFFGADPRRDVEDELAFHFEMRVEEFRRAGMTREAAEAAARKRFGDFDRVRDECQELGRRRAVRSRRASRLAGLRQDVRYALRTVAANRGFSLMVVLTLALGIGATTSVFSVAYGVLLRPLPYRDADALVRLWSKNAERGLEFFSVSPADYAVWRARNRVFAGMAALERQRSAAVVRRAEPQSIEVAAVSPEVFPLLGTAAARGRTLVPDDAREDVPRAAVIAHELWATRFGSDPTLLGGDLTIDGRRYTVVGVMPPRFWVPASGAQIWTPLSPRADSDHANRYLRVLARLRPGVALERAHREMDAIAAELGREFPATNGSWSVNMQSVPETIVGAQFRRALLVLLGVVAFVLVIACANSANLQLARGAARRREIAVRAALGATRARITTQLLVESLVLALAAGVAGLALARGGVNLLRTIGTEMVPRLDEVRLDGPVLAFTALVALGSGALFGLVPALRASRADIGEVLKTGGRGSAGAPGAALRAALVVVEVSLSLVLLVGAGLLMRSFVRLQEVDVGFSPTGVAALRVALPEASYPEPERRAAFFAALLDRVRQIPGVTAAGAVTSAPFAGPNASNLFAREDRPAVGREQAPDADYRVITPGYLRTLGVRVVRGRDFSELDRPGAPATVLISETTARRYWPDEDPIGRRIRFGDPRAGPTFTIVGVVGDVRYQSRETPEVRPMLYFSALARPQQSMTLVARGVGARLPPPAALREAVASLDRSLPPPAVDDMEGLLAEALATPRFAVMLFGVFAGAALLLAAVGVYGVMSYLVRQRTHELGVRSALGASPGMLLRGVIGSTLRLTVTGVALGLVGAWLLTRLIASLLFEVSAKDPLTFGGIALLLTAIGLVAGVVPARRAARADPLVALRDGG